MNATAIATELNSILEYMAPVSEPRRAIEKLIEKLNADIRAAAAKDAKNLKAFRTLEKVLKENRNGPRARLGYAWIDECGRQCFCDGYRAFRMYDGHHVQTEDAPENVGEPIDLNKCYPAEGMLLQYKTLNLPGLQELAAYIKVEKAKQGRKANILYVFEGSEGWKVGVNAEYLLDLMTVIKGANTIKYNSEKVFSLLYASDETGDAILLPVRVK